MPTIIFRTLLNFAAASAGQIYFRAGTPKFTGSRYDLRRILTKATFMREYYAPETTLERRREIFSLFYGGETCTDWVNGYRAEAIALEVQGREKPALVWLDDFLSTGSFTVHQVGCASGRETAFFAARHPDSTFIGSDLLSEAVTTCRGAYSLPNLSFQQADIETGADAIKGDILLASGALPYVHPDRLAAFFAELKTRHIFLGETIIPAPRRGRSRPRGGFQWSHPYRSCLETAGWTIEREEISKHGKARWVNIHASRSI